jgi:hypothetical protein
MLPAYAPSSAYTDIVYSNNSTFSDAIQFDPPVAGVTGPTWDLNNKTFEMEIKANHEQDTALLAITSAAGEIIVDDATSRILHFNVPMTDFSGASIVPGTYVYDLVMLSNDATPIRTVLMHGRFIVTDGVTGGS